MPRYFVPFAEVPCQTNPPCRQNSHLFPHQIHGIQSLPQKAAHLFVAASLRVQSISFSFHVKILLLKKPPSPRLFYILDIGARCVFVLQKGKKKRKKFGHFSFLFFVHFDENQPNSQSKMPSFFFPSIARIMLWNAVISSVIDFPLAFRSVPLKKIMIERRSGALFGLSYLRTPG